MRFVCRRLPSFLPLRPVNAPTGLCEFGEAPSSVKRCNGDTTLWTAAGDRPKELG